jgi:SAM-dependent methyltransferase
MTGSTADASQPAPTGERFDPPLMQGHMIEAEHFARYAWACQFAEDRKVLDAGCGTAYGTAMLAAAGAEEVLGVDLDEGVVEAARAGSPANARFEVADLRELPVGDDEIDLVVCFEAIEHVPDPEKVLDELQRVLAPEGLLLVSTPNRDVYTPGNPFHLRELTPNELEAELSKRFRSVALRRQHSWVASAIFDDEAFGAKGFDPVADVELRKHWEGEPGEETYTIGIAGDGELPVGHGLVSLTSEIDIRDWSSRTELAELALLSAPGGAGSGDAETAMLRTEIEELRKQLVESEAALAHMADVEERLALSRNALEHFELLRKQHEEVISSSSWRLTKPLRRLIARLRGRPS